MKVPFFIRRPLFRLLYRLVAQRRPADQFIGAGPYMLRWWLFGTSKTPDEHGDPKPRRPFGYSAYLHCFLRSDDDRALHDHPWDFTSVILFGEYMEKREVGVYYHREGSVIRSQAADLHRVVLVTNPRSFDTIFGMPVSWLTQLPWMTDAQSWRALKMWREELPAWTLFLAGKWQRKWGFQCADGWKHWRDFDADGGCGEKANG